MKSRDYRKLVALSEIRCRPRTTQRSLAKRIETSLGLANTLLQELEAARLISVRPDAGPDAARYALTARGRRELTHLGASLLSEAGNLLGPVREALSREAGGLRRRGIRKVTLFAGGANADVAAAVLREAGIRVLSVMADNRAKPKTSSADAVVTLSSADAQVARSLFGRGMRIVRLATRGSGGGPRRG